MPTKRRFILFLIVLAVMLLIKRAVGQEVAVGWDPVALRPMSMEDEIAATMLAGFFFGIVSGVGRIWGRSIAAQDGRYFTGDLIELRLR